MMNSGQSEGSQNISNPLGLSDLKQKRDEYNIEIRKKKREDYLRKVRNSNFEIDKKIQVGGFSTLSGSFDTPENSELKKYINEWARRQYNIEEFLDLVEAINSEDRFKQYYGVIGMRKLLSREDDPPIKYAIDYNVVPRLLQLTQFEHEPHLQLEAAWSLTNIASGTTEQTQAIIQNDGIKYFIELLKSSKAEIAEQAVWALGNISGDCHEFKDLVIKHNAVESLVYVVQNSNNSNAVKLAIWTLSNLCRGKKPGDFEILNYALPVFCRAIEQTTDSAILIDSIWALAYLSDSDTNQIQKVLETKVLDALATHLENLNLSVLAPVIRIIGNITSEANEEQINFVLQTPNLIQNLFKLTSYPKRKIKQEVCWVLSNITAGNQNQMEVIIGNASYLEKLISMIMSENVDVQREALWVLANATHRCNLEQMFRMSQLGVVDCFYTLLEYSQDAKVLEVLLDGINQILKKGDRIAEQTGNENPYLAELVNKGGVVRIEALQKHPAPEVYRAALKLLEKHFDLEDEN